MKKRIIHAVIAASAFATASVAMAATPLQLSSDIFIEHQIKQANGALQMVLEAPKVVTPGDSLVFVVHYKNVGKAPASNFTVTNPLPRAVRFNGTQDGKEIVSVDGGKSWGMLSSMTVSDGKGKMRPASMDDVTHIKWNLNQTLAAGSEGKLMFRGVVK